jgi:hypothetical protein
MASERETRFNTSAAEVFMPEYRKETGIELRLVAADREFPDLVLQNPSDGRTVEAELVEVILSFVNREQDVLRRYEEELGRSLASLRPSYIGKLIRLQISHAAATGDRPHCFPHPQTPDAKAIFAEFQQLMEQNREAIIQANGGLLSSFTSTAESPMLMRHFDAVLIMQSPLPSAGHPDDPRIDLTTVTVYNVSEIALAVRNALETKIKKRSAYQADLLILHTMQADHKPHSPVTGVHVKDIIRAGSELGAVALSHFSEVWFLSGYAYNGNRLFRLA